MNLPATLIAAVVLALLVVGLRVAALIKARRTGRALRGIFVGRPILRDEDPAGYAKVMRQRTIELVVVILAILAAFVVVLKP